MTIWRVIMAYNPNCTPYPGGGSHIARRKLALYPGGHDCVQYEHPLLWSVIRNGPFVAQVVFGWPEHMAYNALP